MTIPDPRTPARRAADLARSTARVEQVRTGRDERGRCLGCGRPWEVAQPTLPLKERTK